MKNTHIGHVTGQVANKIVNNAEVTYHIHFPASTHPVTQADLVGALSLAPIAAAIASQGRPFQGAFLLGLGMVMATIAYWPGQAVAKVHSGQ